MFKIGEIYENTDGVKFKVVWVSANSVMLKSSSGRMELIKPDDEWYTLVKEDKND